MSYHIRVLGIRTDSAYVFELIMATKCQTLTLLAVLDYMH